MSSLRGHHQLSGGTRRNRLPSQNSFHDAPFELAPDLRTDAVSLQQHLAIHDECPAEIDQREIGVKAHSNLSLACDAKSARRISREKLGDAIERQTIQQRWERGLDARDAAPDAKEIVACFHFERRGRVVAADNIYTAVAYGVPKMLLFRGVAQGRRAFRNGADALHVFTGEGQVVRA